MRVKGCDNVWAIGDAAAVPDPAKAAARRARRPPSTRSARAAWSGATWRRRCRAEAAAVPLPHARRVRGPRAAQGRGDDARPPPARLPGLVRGPHLPPRDDARHGAPGPAAVDWTVGLVFGRASAELGQLGHPPSLGHLPRRGATNPASGRRRVSELSFREGRASDLEAVYELGEAAWDSPAPRAA